MDDKDIEQTKEINTLKDLSLEALNNLEETTKEETLEEFDENLEDANLVFKTEVETKNEVKEELQKENIFKKINHKWNGLDKKKKIIFVGIMVLILICLIIGLLFLLRKTEGPKEPIPDVILEKDNYRYENGKLVFLDEDKELGTYECENKDEKLCEVAYLTDDDFDTTKKVDEEGNPLILRSQIYHEKYVFIVDHKTVTDKEIKLYDMLENKVIETVFEVKAYPNDYVALKNKESKYGLEKLEKETVTKVIPYEYDYLGVLPDQNEMKYIVVQKDNNSYLANFENKILTKAFNTKIVGATDKIVKTKDSTLKYHVYDYEAKEKSEAPQEYVSLLDNYLISIRSNKIYVLDYDGNYMLREGIDLNNKFYNRTETYKDLKLIKTSQAFDYELTNNILNINVYNEDSSDKENHAINLYEGKLSSKLAYLDYFNGTLGFYTDLEKKTFIGSYACTNRNTVEKDTTTLNNCRIATESFFRETTGNTKERDESSKLAWIPIFGRQYAFIKDGDGIVLYRIPSQEVIAKYESVDTSSYNGTFEVVLSDAGVIPFIAKSKSSGKFGVAKITTDGVKPVIPFESESIKRLGDYYVVQSNDGYALYDLDGQKKSAIVVSQIVDYHNANLKVFKDNNYFVYDFEGKGTGKAYTYVELHDSFYAAVVQNKVRLYDYSGKDLFEGLTEETNNKLELTLNNYYGEGTKAFRIAEKPITIDGVQYYVVEIGLISGEYKTVNVPVDNKEVDPKPGDTNES